MLKLLIYAKIQHINPISSIADMTIIYNIFDLLKGQFTDTEKIQSLF